MTEPVEGTVVRIRSVLCEVDAGGCTYACAARRRLVDSDTGESKPLVVGDRVVVTPMGGGEGVIEDVLPRRTKLSRRSPRDPLIEHVIVANVDQMVVVASVRRPPLTLGIIDRYVIAGEAGGLEPIVCINKIDLAGTDTRHLDAADVYREMEYPVLLTSARTGEGVDGLRDALGGRSSTLVGHSGVGKSALLNAVQPGLRLRTREVTTRGRHTTTSVSLLRLTVGGYVVDTPGIRELSLWDIEPHEVQQFFPRIWETGADCKMPDCLHIHEPACAVKHALELGEIPADRYGSYVRIVETTQTPDVPRMTDVDDPKHQIARSKREQSRRSRRQRLHRRAALEMDEDAEADADP